MVLSKPAGLCDVPSRLSSPKVGRALRRCIVALPALLWLVVSAKFAKTIVGKNWKRVQGLFINACAARLRRTQPDKERAPERVLTINFREAMSLSRIDFPRDAI